MPNPIPFLLQKPFSLAHARSTFAGTDPKRLALLIRNMPWDYYMYVEDFDIALDTNRWTTSVTGGAASGPAFVLSAFSATALYQHPTKITFLRYAHIHDPHGKYVLLLFLR